MLKSPILCFFAHPDDETLAAGGTIARFAPSVEFTFAIPATGIAARIPLFFGDQIPKEVRSQIGELRQNCEKALFTLGIPDDTLVCFGGFPDNRFDGLSLLDLVHWLEKAMADARPRTILTHSPKCLNVDHRRCYEAAMTATRQSDVTVLCGEIPGSTGILQAWQPNFYVKLNPERVDRKITAMQAYRSERRESPHPRSPEMLEALARVRGSECGAEFAEAFEVRRWVL